MMTRAWSCTGEINGVTWNVRSLRRRGARHAATRLQKSKVLGCDVIGLQKTRRSGRTEFAAASYHVFYSGENKSSGRAGQQ